MGVILLRATLRAPPAKWAIKAFFPAGERSEPRSRTAPKGLPQTEARDAQRGGPPLESPCRQLSLVLSFASKESTSPPRCGSPTVRAGVGASGPRQELLSAKLPYNAACRGFPLAPCTPSVRLPKRIYNPTGLYLHSAPESTRQSPYQKIAYGKDNV